VFLKDELIFNQMENNLDLALNLMSRKLDMQNHAHSALEQKMGYFLGFIGALAGGAIALIQGRTELLGLNIFTLGFSGIYITLVLLAIASRARKYLDPPDFPAFYSKESLSKEVNDTKNQAVADMKAAYLENSKIHEEKAVLFNRSLEVFILSILFLVLGVLELGYGK
jgi:hypothetical protein